MRPARGVIDASARIVRRINQAAAGAEVMIVARPAGPIGSITIIQGRADDTGTLSIVAIHCHSVITYVCGIEMAPLKPMTVGLALVSVRQLFCPFL